MYIQKALRVCVSQQQQALYSKSATLEKQAKPRSFLERFFTPRSHGSHEADCAQVDWRPCAAEAARHQGRAQGWRWLVRAPSLHDVTAICRQRTPC